MIEGIRGSAAYRGGASGDNGGILWVRNPVGLLWVIGVRLVYCCGANCTVGGHTVLSHSAVEDMRRWLE